MFRRMDDSGNKVLEFEEFHKGIIETGLKGVSEDDAREMFNHFDKDGGGTVNIDEFLMAIRVGSLILPHESSTIQKQSNLHTVKSRAVDWSTIQVWNFLVKGHST